MENEIKKGQQMTEKETNTDENTLPEGVTDEPQSPEHMDLRTIKDSDKKWLKVYLKVSDDQGHLLDDQPLEEKVIKTCEEMKTRKYFKVENSETLIRETKELIENYAISINSAENSAVGTLTKYRIRVGILLIYLQWLVKKYLKMEWVEYFNKNFKSQQLRSYQDYMRLAKYPNVIKYAWLGKERLLRLIKIIGAPDSVDPIGDYLKLFGLEFNPEEEINYGSMKLKIDVTIYRHKLREKEVYDIPDDKIESMVQRDVQLTPSVLEEFEKNKNAVGDLIKLVDILLASKGKPPPKTSPERKAENIKKTLDRFIDQAKSALVDKDYLKGLDIESINELQEQINALRDKIEQRSE